MTLALEERDDLSPAAAAEKVSALLLDLAQRLAVKGAVPGHIKALLEEGGRWARFSCTRPGDVGLVSSEDWDEGPLRSPILRLNAIVVSPSEGEAERALREALESSGLRLRKNMDHQG